MVKRKRTIKQNGATERVAARLIRASRDLQRMQKEISPFIKERRLVENTTDGQWQQHTGPCNRLNPQEFS